MKVLLKALKAQESRLETQVEKDWQKWGDRSDTWQESEAGEREEQKLEDQDDIQNSLTIFIGEIEQHLTDH